MANLQVKNFPDDLHEELRARAARERRSISEVVTDMVEHQLRIHRLDDWLEENLKTLPTGFTIHGSEIINEVRAEYAGD